MIEPLPARFSTGNKFIALPDIRTRDCAVETLSFLHHGLRAAVELHGNDQLPLLEPLVSVNGIRMALGGAQWDLLNHWIPRFKLQTEDVEVTGIVFAPLEHKGVIFVLEIKSCSREQVDISAGWQGCWQDTYHITKLSKAMSGTMHAGLDPRHDSSMFMEFRYAAPMFAMGICPGQPMDTDMCSAKDPAWRVNSPGQPDVSAPAGHAILYKLTSRASLAPEETTTLVLHVGVGLEETSAVSAALDLRRHGWQHMLNRLMLWLERRTYHLEDERLAKVLNLNSFYNYFFSEGMTVDTEELVLVSSRSSRHPGSAAYNDREAMLWSLPAILKIDPPQARRMLEYAFTVQLRNVGVQSRFLDGVVLEPGFGLGELCAPIRALWKYLYDTGDMSIVFDRRVQTGLNRIQQLMASAKHPKLNLYETFLLPSNEVTGYPYVTYDNVLVWRSVRDVAWIYDRIRDVDRTQEMLEMANSIRRAIMTHCMVKGPFGDMFAWSVDLAGNCELADEPAGSLQLLAPLEFCSPDLPAYKNTVRWIHSENNPYSFANAEFSACGCRQGNHPSILAVANDLLAGRVEEASDFLRRTRMDDLIACEFVDENTGSATSGLAFAAAAGYIAHALASANGARTRIAEPVRRELSIAERISEHPPEIRDSVDTGRM